MFEKRHVKADSLSVDYMKAIWNGDKYDEYAEGAIIGTMAIALKTTGKAISQDEAFELARQQWGSRNKKHFDSHQHLNT